MKVRITLGGISHNKNFRLLFSGESISLLGDQFYFVALTFLVLKLKGSPLDLGGVLALGGVPRAALMLLGGALADRLSPRGLMLLSNTARMILVTGLALAVLGGAVRLWILFAFSFVFGLADAFFLPAQSALIPQIADRRQLQPANALVQGASQLALTVGPGLAGFMIVQLDGNSASLTGMGWALVVDAASFLASVLALHFMHVDKGLVALLHEHPPESVASSVKAGLSYMWSDPMLKGLFLIILAINFLVVGPLLVGIPVIANSRLSVAAAQRPAAYGIAWSSFGLGSLVGIIAAGVLPRPAAHWTRRMLLAICAVFGIGLALLGFASSTAVASALAFVMGAGTGYLQILFFTWLQSRTPPKMMGRILSLIIFASVGLVPVSQALSGALIRLSLPAVFVGAGAMLVVITVRAALNPHLRRMGTEMLMTPPDWAEDQARDACGTDGAVVGGPAASGTTCE